MNITSQRFGALEIDEEQVLNFPHGVIGFPHEQEFVLVPHNATGFLAWLQSAKTPELALPVVSAHAFGAKYPDIDMAPLISDANLGGEADERSPLPAVARGQRRDDPILEEGQAVHGEPRGGGTRGGRSVPPPSPERSAR